MISYKDVQFFFKTYNYEEQQKDYLNRQFANLTSNNQKEIEFIWQVNPSLLSMGLTPDQAFSLLIHDNFNSNNGINRLKFFQLFKKNNGKEIIDILFMINKTDYFWNKEINFEQYRFLASCMLAILSVQKVNEKELSISTMFGSVNFKKAYDLFGIQEVHPSKRRKLCHVMTAAILNSFPFLEGAYYYLPFYFTGALEHSVILDRKNNMVFDFANNVALPYSFWQSIYPNPAFTISGEEFVKLNEQVEKEFQLKLNMSTIEQVRRKIK